MNNSTHTTNGRLANIASRQKASRLRDLMFAAFVVVAAAISVNTISNVASANHFSNAEIAQR